MSAENAVLPCLKAATWGGGQDSVARPLWAGQDSPYMPWVGFGYDHPHAFEFLNQPKLSDLGSTREQLERDAIKHLSVRPATWQHVDVKLSLFKRLKLLACADDFLAAERILDAAFMIQAQRMLGVRALFVGVPRRGYLLAMDGEGGADRIQVFATLVVTEFQGGESAPISPIAFGVKDGEIVGILEAVAQALIPPEQMASGSVGVQNEDEDDEDQEEDADAPYVSTLVLKNTAGLEDVLIMAGGSDFDKLARGIVSTLAGTMSQHLARAEFSGTIKVVILAMTPEPVKVHLPQLEEHLKGILADVATSCPDKQLSISLEQQAGDSPFP